MSPIFRRHDNTAARRNHLPNVARQLRHHLRFQLPKHRFPGFGKDFADGLLGDLFDQVVGIEKLILKAIGKQFSDRCFARSHHADEIQTDALKVWKHGYTVK